MWTGSKNDLVKFLNKPLSIKFVYEILKKKKKFLDTVIQRTLNYMIKYFTKKQTAKSILININSEHPINEQET